MTLDLSRREVPTKVYDLTPDEARIPERVADVLMKLQRDGLLQGMATQERNRMIERETTVISSGVQQVANEVAQSGAQRIMLGYGLDLTSATSQTIGVLRDGPWEVTRATVLVKAITGTLSGAPRFGIQVDGSTIFDVKTHAGTPVAGSKWRLNDSVGLSPPVTAGGTLTLNVATAATGVTELLVDVYVFGHLL